MISLLLVLSFFGVQDPPEGDGDCQFKIVREGPGLMAGGDVAGFWAGDEGDCCSTVAFHYMVDNNTGADDVIYELRVTITCEGSAPITLTYDRAVLNDGDWDILSFRMPDELGNCNCGYTIQLYRSGATFADSDGENFFSFFCSEECDPRG